MGAARWRRHVLVAVALAAIAAAALAHAWSQAWLCDDAFISFRYCRQLVAGQGLVFNRGERVEGYTNFLWVLEVALGMRLGASPERAALVLSVLSTLGLGGVVVALVRSSPLGKGAWWPALAALVVLAANRSVAVWTTSGLETRHFTMWTCLSVLLVGRALAARRGRGRDLRLEVAASVAAALAEATRPEGLLVFACLGVAYVALGPGRDVARERALGDRWREVLALALPFVVLVGAHYVFRRVYYGDWLPNTYYAKHVRPWPESGDRYFAAAAIEHGAIVLLPLAALGAWARARSRDVAHVVSIAVVAVHALYVRRIGGDHFEFRPLDFYWPLLTAAAMDGVLAIRAHPRWRSPRAAIAGAAAAFALLLEYGTVVQRAYEHEIAGRGTRRDAYKLFAEIGPTSAPELRFVLPGAALRLYNACSHYCVDHQSCSRRGEHAAYYRLLEEEYGAYRTLTDEEAARFLPADATWAREAVGFAPYMVPGVTVIDVYGLTDRTVAHTPVDTPNERRLMAHDRHPPPGYLEARGINIEIGPASRTQGEALRHAYWAVRVRDDLWIPFRAFDGRWVANRFAGKPLYSQIAFALEDPTDTLGWVDGEYRHATELLGGFDKGTLDGWEVTAGGPLAAARAPFGDGPPDPDVWQVGAGCLSTARAAGAVHVRSPAFVAHGHLALLLAGGGGGSALVVIDADAPERAPIATLGGRGVRRFELASLDLRPHAGKRLRLELRGSEAAPIAIDQVVLLEPAR